MKEYDRASFDAAFKDKRLTMNNLFVFMLRNTSDENGQPAPGLILASYLSMLHTLTVKLIDAWPEALKTTKPEFTGYVVSLAYYLGMLSANTKDLDKESWAASVTHWADKMLGDEPGRHAVVMELVNARVEVDKLYVEPAQT